MSFRLYLYLMGFASVAAWTAWILVAHAIDPVTTGLLGFLLFYFTLLIAIIGTFSLFGAGLRSWGQPSEHPSRHTVRSLRQGIILGMLFISVLIMLSQGVLRWWSFVLALFLSGLLELLCLSLQRRT